MKETPKVVITAAGQVRVLAHKKIQVNVNVSPDQLLDTNREDFYEQVSQALFGNSLFEIEKLVPHALNGEENISLMVHGNIKKMVEAGKIEIIDQPKLII